MFVFLKYYFKYLWRTFANSKNDRKWIWFWKI